MATTKAAIGLNLPPQCGSTNKGAFLPGIYKYAYPDSFFQEAQEHGFRALRIPVNVETAKDLDSLAKIAGYFELIGGTGTVCLFDTKRDDQGSHGRGRPSPLEDASTAWKALHDTFAEMPGIKYEIFNEPFGYKEPGHYLDDMQAIIEVAGLPPTRCVLDGMGYADDVEAVINSGWQWDVAYHFYPNWLNTTKRTQEAYSNKVQSALREWGPRVHIPEFGADLSRGDVYEKYDPTGDDYDRNALRGLHDALRELSGSAKGVKSTYHWHGWRNGDSYDLWFPQNKYGAEKVARIQRDA